MALTPFKVGHGVENLRVSPVTKCTPCAAAGKAPDILRAEYHVLTAWLLLPLCLRATIDDRKFDMQAPSLAGRSCYRRPHAVERASDRTTFVTVVNR